MRTPCSLDVCGVRAGKLGTLHALQITARFSFLLFWLAYASGGLVLLIGIPIEFLPDRACSPSPPSLSISAWAFGSVGSAPHRGRAVRLLRPPTVVLYVLVLFSIPTLQQRLGRTLWTVLRTVGMTYIAYAFAADSSSALPRRHEGMPDVMLGLALVPVRAVCPLVRAVASPLFSSVQIRIALPRRGQMSARCFGPPP